MRYKELKKIYYADKNNYVKIYENRFNSEETLKFDIDINHNQAFFVYTREMFLLITAIHRQDKKLRKISSELPKAAQLQFRKSCLVEEIRLTNEIEGVISTRKEIEEIMELVDEEAGEGRRMYSLVKKYMLLTKEELSLNSCSDIRSIYDILVLDEIKKEKPENVPDGVIFRKGPVYVRNKRGEIIHEGIPGEEAIIRYVDKAIEILQSQELDAIVSSAIFHYLFGYIHPFYDGNGRMSRYISSKLLSEELHELIGYSLSYTIKKNITQYYKLFQTVNDIKNKGDLTPFVLGFLKMILQAEEYLNEKLLEKKDMLRYYENKLNVSYNSDKKDITKYLLLQNSLFGSRGLSIEEIAKIAKISDAAVRKHLQNIGRDKLRVTRDGHKKLYDIDLERVRWADPGCK